MLGRIEQGNDVKRISIAQLLGWGGVLLGAFLLYLPGLSGGFVFDDLPNLVLNEKLTRITGLNWSELVWAMWSSDSGPTHRPLAMLTFALNFVVGGLDPWGYKLVNILIHLLAGSGLFLLTRNILRSPYGALDWPKALLDTFPAVVATVWLVHPLQLTSVLYVVQRMASLASLFCVLGLWSYSTGRLRQVNGRSGWSMIAIAYLLAMPLALFSKENGALLPLSLLLLELAFFRGRCSKAKERRQLFVLHSVIAILPIALGMLYLIVWPSWILRSYTNRDFDLLQRMYTESRILWQYLSWIVFPDIRTMGLYHDDFQISHGLIRPWTTLFSIVAWIVVICGTLLAWRRFPYLFFGVLFFLNGHLLESTAFGLELMHEHRNYLPLYGIQIGVLWAAFQWRSASLKISNLDWVILASCLAVLSGLTMFRSYIWGDDLRRAMYQVAYHFDSPRSNIDAGGALLNRYQQTGETKWLAQAKPYYERAEDLDLYSANGVLGILVISNQLGEPLDRSLVKKAEARLGGAVLASSTPDALIRLIQCETSGSCHFGDEVLLNLVRVLVENPRLRELDRGRLLTEMVQMFVSKNNYDNALIFAFGAVSAKPTHPQFHLNAAAVLLMHGDCERAKLAIDEAKKQDRDRFYSIRVEAMRTRLGQSSCE